MAQTPDLAELEMAFAKDPTGGAFVPLTQAYLAQGRFMEAMVVCKKGIKSQPGNVEGRLLLARVYGEQGKVPKALEELRTLLAQAPKVAAAHYQLGVMLDKSGKGDEAVESFKEALRQDRNLADATAALKGKGIDWSPGPSPEEIAAAEAARKAEEDRRAEEARRLAEEEAARQAEEARKAAEAQRATQQASAAKSRAMGAAIQQPRGATSGPVSGPAFPSMSDPSFASTSGAYGMFSGPVPVAAQGRRLGPGFTFGLAALLLLVIVAVVFILKSHRDTQDKITYHLKAAQKLVSSDTTAGHKLSNKELESALKLDDEQPLALSQYALSLSILANQRGEKELDQAAQDATKKAMKYASEQPGSVAAEMVWLRQAGKGDEAIAAAKKVNADELALPISVRIQVGRTYAAMKKVPEMIKIADSLREVPDPGAQAFVGESYRRIGDQNRARAALDNAMKNEIDHDPSRALRALVILEADDTVHFNVAIDDLNTLKELGKDAVGTRQRGYASLGLAVMGSRLGRAEAENKRELETARAALRTDAEIPQFEAKQALDAGELERAITSAEASIAIDAVRLQPYLQIVEAASRSKKWSKADDALSRAAAVFGDNLDLGLAKAARLRDEEKYDEAVASLSSLKAKFDVAEVYRDIGKVYMRNGDLPKAVEVLKEAAKKSGARAPAVQANVYTWLGRAFAAGNEHESAAEVYGQALAATSDHASTYYFMGVSMAALKKDGAARESFDKYLRADPNGTYAEQARQRRGAL
ncbi:MAG: tetratricopeptide repeat protein [Deltaproteobacteria bacterium]|nr:tetratricopeptide repeat protein [Deltaproteobacteria bacterium]